MDRGKMNIWGDRDKFRTWIGEGWVAGGQDLGRGS